MKTGGWAGQGREQLPRVVMGPTVPAVGKSVEVRDSSWLRRRSDGRHHAEAPVDVHRMTRGYLVT